MDEPTLEIDLSTIDTWEFTDKEKQELWDLIYGQGDGEKNGPDDGDGQIVD